MTAAPKHRWISVEAYLAGELTALIKHEYVDGIVYAMAGATNRHNTIAVNIVSALHMKLRGNPCRPFNSDTKIHIRSATQTRFYYPDALVTCRPNPDNDSYQDHPNLIIEVLSEGTRRIDEGEKKDAYLSLPSMEAYLLVGTTEPSVVVYRRTDRGFVREVIEDPAGVIPLPFLGTELTLAEIYENSI